MKPTLLGAVILFTITPLHAQISKGDIFLSGVFSLSSNSNINQNNAIKTVQNNFSLRPSVGYFTSDRVAIGIGFEYEYDYNSFQYYLDPGPGIKQHSRLFSFAPFARYYIPISKSFFVVFHGEVAYGVGSAVVPNYYTVPN